MRPALQTVRLDEDGLRALSRVHADLEIAVSPGADVGGPGADVGGVSPVLAQMWAGVSPVPAQMWAGVSPVPAQMWWG